MRGRTTFLRPLRTTDVPWLMESELDASSATSWRFRGVDVTAAGYLEDVEDYDEAWVVFGIADGRRLGLVGIKGFDPYLGTAYIHVVSDPQVAAAGTRLFEAIALVLTHAFSVRDGLRKVYGEIPAFLWPAYRSGADKLFAVEGRLTEHVRRGDDFFDLWVIAFRRQRWLEQFGQMRDLITDDADG